MWIKTLIPTALLQVIWLFYLKVSTLSAATVNCRCSVDCGCRKH